MMQSTITRRAALVALTAGAQARAEGLRVTACPFTATGDADDRLLTAAWVRGFVLAGSH